MSHDKSSTINSSAEKESRESEVNSSSDSVSKPFQKSGKTSSSKDRGSQDSNNSITFKTKKLKTFLLKAVFILTVASAGTYGMLWYQEGNLRKAKEFLAQKKNYDKALMLVDSYLDEHPQDSRALALKARVLVELHLPNEAIAILDKISGGGPAYAEDFETAGMAYMQLKQWSIAVPLLKTSLEKGPNNGDVLYALSVANFYLGDYDAAMEYALKFTAMPGNEARGNLLLGTFYNKKGAYSKAVAAFEKVLQFSPKLVDLLLMPHEFHYQYGMALFRVGRNDEAIKSLKKSLASEETLEAVAMMGIVLTKMGNNDQAKIYLKRALEYDTRIPEVLESMATVMLSDGKASEALKFIEPLKDTPEMSSSTAFLFQQIHTRLNDKAAAEEWRIKAEGIRKRESLYSSMNQLLLESPESSWAFIFRAYNFAREKNWEQAQSMFGFLPPEAMKDEFVIELKKAIDTRGEVPPVERIPIKQFF